jgi:hypothetical protein
MLEVLIIGLVLQQAQPTPAPTATATASGAIAAAATPGDCVKALQMFVGKRQQEVRPPAGFTAELIRQVETERAALARTCLARFPEDRVPAAQLGGLSELYTQAGDAERARAVMTRAMAAPLPAAERAGMLATAINVTLTEPKGDERNARLEKMIDELDTIAVAAFDQRFFAHRRLLGYYRGDDIDAGIIKHAAWIAAAAATFTPEERQKYGRDVVMAQVDMAEALAGQAQNDEALALLRRMQKDWSDVPRVDSYLTPAIERYSLVGTAAAPIVAPRWLNAPADMKEMAMDGAVTLLEFTAHWCGPCRESYPGVNRLRSQFAPQGFRVVMATRYWGYFSKDGKTERPLAPADELARDVEYFKGYSLDVPVAIGDESSGADVNDRNYKVSGIPQIQLIDRHGRIRLIMIGYDEANEPKLAAQIAKLLAEK